MIVLAAVLIVVHFALTVYLLVLAADIKQSMDNKLNSLSAALLMTKGESAAARTLVPKAKQAPEHPLARPTQIGLTGR